MRVIVVGAGIVGLSIAWALTKRGHSVSLVEQAAAIPSDTGASGDYHRILRRDFEGTHRYGSMTTEALSAWEELWMDLKVTPYVNCGAVALSYKPGDGGDRFKKNLDRARFPYDCLGPGETAELLPFLNTERLRYGIVSREGGVLLCQEITKGLLAWLGIHGVKRFVGRRVTSVDEAKAVVRLTTGEELSADRLVLAIGAGIVGLRPDLRPRVSVFTTTVAYIRPPPHLLTACSTSPAIFDFGGVEDAYLVPPVAGTPMKVGSGLVRRPAAWNSPHLPIDVTHSDAARLLQIVARRLRVAEGYELEGWRTCTYTFTRDSRFYSEFRHKALWVSACSGHAYKFGAIIGCRAAQAISGENHADFCAWLAGRRRLLSFQ